jgi:hypothetical protein
MAAGASDTSTFSGIYAITQADVDAGVVYNLAIVTGNPPIGRSHQILLLILRLVQPARKPRMSYLYYNPFTKPLS